MAIFVRRTRDKARADVRGGEGREKRDDTGVAAQPTLRWWETPPGSGMNERTHKEVGAAIGAGSRPRPRAARPKSLAMRNSQILPRTARVLHKQVGWPSRWARSPHHRDVQRVVSAEVIRTKGGHFHGAS